MISDRLLTILRSCESVETSQFPPTEIFNEGWMLRLVLDAIQASGLRDYPLRFLDGSKWYSEARLGSPFRARSRADALAEGFTNADGVIGHFSFSSSTKAGFRLLKDARQFVVIEAKMFSNLSAGTTKVKVYDQAARNVACMAQAMAASGKSVDDFEDLGFYVIAPMLDRRKHRDTNLESCIDPGSIRRNVSQRIVGYEEVSRSEAAEFRLWEREYFLPLVERLASTNALAVLSWEDCIAAIAVKDEIAGKELQSFYDRCLQYESVPAA